MTQPNGKNAILRIVLVVFGAFSVLCLSVATVLHVNAAGVLYTGVNDNAETVYDINFVQSGNQSDSINRIYVTGTDSSSTVIVTPNTIVSQYYSEGSEVFGNINTVTGYSQILGGSGIRINSDNITVLGGNTNVVETGNDNLTILGGRGNIVLGGSNGGSPVVVVGGSGNQVGISQDGTIIIGGGANVLGTGVTNAQILGGEGNKIGEDVDNVTIAGTNIENNMSNTFVFSDGDLGTTFVPSIPNAFYIISANGLGLNNEFSGGGVSSAGGIYVGAVDINTMECNAERVGIQGTAQGGCLVGCTQSSSDNNRWELLGTSEMCVEWCKSNELCENPLEIEYEDIPSYCIGTVVAGATHCDSLSTSNYSNSVFMVDFVNVCPSNPLEVSNPCTYKCPDGYSSAGGCKKDCTFGSGSSKITIHHGESVTGYLLNTLSCSLSSEGKPNPCDVPNSSYQIRTCDNGKLLGGNQYHNISCMAQGVDCSDEYNLTAKTESGGVYSTCTGYIAGGNICTQNIKYKLTDCESGYSYVKVGENYRCFPDCTFNGKTVHYGESVTGYSSTDVTCVGNSTYCDSRKLTCQSDGTFGSEGLVYSRTGCSVSEVVPPSYYNLTECPKANASQGTTADASMGGKINAGVQIGICESFTGYSVSNNTCSAYMRYHLTGCIAGYTQSGDRCLPNCILPWSTGNLQYGVNNSLWSSQSITWGASITGYKYQTRNCSGDWCDKVGNRAIMKCNQKGVLSGSATYKYKSCVTQPLESPASYCRFTTLDNSVWNKFIPYGVENNLCKELAPRYETLKCATGYTWNESPRCGTNAKCLKDCSMTVQPSGRTVYLSGWTGSPKSSIVTYKYGSYTCPNHYTQFTETRQCNNGSLNGTFVYTGYTQNGVVCDTVNDGTRTGIRTITGQISNATQKRNYCINYTYNSSSCITGYTYYYYQCNSGFVWSENQPKCIQCSGTNPIHSHKNNGNYPLNDTTTYYYSTDTSLPCTFSCDEGYYWSGSLNACIGNCKFTDGGEIAPNETSVVYKNPSPVCSNACESKTLTCKYGQWYEGNNIVEGYNYKNCATVDGYKLGTASPVAGQCNVTGNSGSKGNKVFTNATYTGGNASSVPAKQCFDYSANGKTCVDSTKYYVYYCSGTFHWETINSRLLCTSDSKSVQCTQEGKPANSSYILANVTIAWNVSNNAWNKAANCEWKCDGGYYRAGTSCTSCPAGSYCPAGSTSATTCPAGSYCPAGSTSATTCPSGYTSDQGAKVNTECYLPVPNGKYKTTPTGSTLQSCPAGKYKALHNSYYNSSDSCETCVVGKYSLTGSSSCTSCPSGYTSLAGAKADTECYIGVAAGKYKTTPTGTTTQNCAAGTYKAAHNSYYNSSDSCTQCGVGTYSAAGASSCSGCPSGYTSVAGNTGQANCYITVTAGKYLKTANTSTFTDCAAGTYKGQHNVYYGNTSSCLDCTAGNYCPAQSSTTTSCPSGYTSNAKAKANTECYINVGGGKYKTTPTGISTQNCAAGTYKSDHISYYNSSDSCDNCPAGSYCVAGSSSATSCTTLGSNYTSSEKATSPSSCYITCAAGKYLGTANANSCSNCTAGTYKPQHTVNYGNTSSCECCAKGYYSSAGTSACTKCPGSMSTDSTCGSAITSCKITCSAGSYLKKGGSSCTSCPAGSKCPGGTFSYNASSDQGITQCACGTYSAAGASSCTDCGAGMYSNAGASTCNMATAGCYANSSCSCTACPSGYTSNARAASQSDCYITVPAGKYLGTAKGTSFTYCAIGKYKAQHTVNYGGTSSCDSCSAGYTTAGTGSTSSSACIATKCPASGGCPETANGGKCITYSSASVTCPNSCTSRESTCNNGTWSSTPYTYSTCTRGATCTSSSLLTSCPSTCNCQACSVYVQGTCASDGSKYTITSAKEGYYINGSTCSAVCAPSSSSCNGGYTLSGGAQWGYNYYCKKSGSTTVTCTCPQNTIWNGTKCAPVSSICNNSATNPSTAGCSMGAYSVVSTSNGYVWNCKDAGGDNLNSSVCYRCNNGYHLYSNTCTQNAACGTANGTSRHDAPSTAAQKCSKGTASQITTNTNSFTWTCSNGNSTVNCSATRTYNGCTGPCGSKSNGESLTCYASSSPTCPTTCSSQTRTCSDGNWNSAFTATYTASSCSAQGTTCNTTTYPLTSKNVSNASTYNTCTQYTAGTCAASYRYSLATCAAGYTKVGNECKKNCAASGGCSATAHGGTCITYANNAPTGSACSATTSTCNNGSWDVTPKSYSSCTAYCAAAGACSKMAQGNSCSAYPTEVVAYGNSCTKVTATCQSNGKWDKTPGTSVNCGVCSSAAEPNSTYTQCLFRCSAKNGCSESSPGTVCTTYSTNLSNSCSSYKITSTCNGSNGYWSTTPGNYTSCRVPNSCPASGGCPATAHGGTCTSYSQPYSTGSPCSSYARTSTCNDGTWSPAPYAQSSCRCLCGSSYVGEGGTCTRYTASSATGPTKCSSLAVTSTCSDGLWSNGGATTIPGGSSASCTQYCPASGGCSKTAAGGTCTTYSTSTSSSCSSYKRTSTCQSDGTWSSTPYSYSSCSSCYSSCPSGYTTACNSYCIDSTVSLCDGTLCYKYSSTPVSSSPSCLQNLCTCFPAGTKVIMGDKSLKNIENIQTGDVVLTYNIDTEEFESNEVIAPITHKDSSDDMYELTIDGAVLRVTDAHRFYVIYDENDGLLYDWVAARDLKVGDRLFMVTGKYGIVENIEHYSNKETVYNLTVANNHNYFVDRGYLVHNVKEVHDPTAGMICTHHQSSSTEVCQYNDGSGLPTPSSVGCDGAWYQVNDDYDCSCCHKSSGTTYCAAYGGCSKTAAGGTCTTYSTSSSDSCSSYKRTSTCKSNGTWSQTPYSYSSCSAPSSTCFTAGTKITMADGTEKNIEEVKTGEKLLGTDGTVNTVLGYDRPILGERHLWSINGSEYFVSDEHPFKTTEGWKSFNPEMTKREIDLDTTELKVGDVLVTERGYEEVKTVDYIDGEDDIQLYNFELDGDHTYYANGYLVHNKVSPSIDRCRELCFLSGTKVFTQEGLKNIEDLQEGDMALSYNVNSGEQVYNRVAHTISREVTNEELYEFTIENNKLKVTGSHVFYVVDTDDGYQCSILWKPAKNLVVGDVLLKEDGSYVTIDGINTYLYSGMVYNFEVENTHGYYVGGGYLVHNIIVTPEECLRKDNPLP